MIKSKIATTALSLALLTGVGAAVALSPALASSDVQLASCSPCAAKKMNPCNPCAAKKMNPCAAKKKMNPCNPCNPCAAKNACNPCNPCAGKKK